MPKYSVTLEWSGYSRGTSTYEVEAENKEDALENYDCGRLIYNEIVRDDREKEATEAELL